ncbi:hypothetical protein [Novosphingobium sediminicola]|uniref:Uncharacterized protein n=1 Tax=Novosphingobium sediminicola TaxID=563162 RepID=A0A7W6G612_9SPHN|nr:hypothetical protein [Novosphingobium sediminicola]MBB3955329.1 hypothetical protein [Novosphingobium sediminicola]
MAEWLRCVFDVILKPAVQPMSAAGFNILTPRPSTLAEPEAQHRQ